VATRFYLPWSGSPAVSVTKSSYWNGTQNSAEADDFASFAAVTTRISSTMTTVTLNGNTDAGNTNYCFGQWVSAPIDAQTIGAQTIKIQARALEESSRANQVIALSVRVVSGDGTTVRGTVLEARDASEVVNVLTNRGHSATSTSVSASAGDRIVIEVGMGGDPTTGSGGDSHDGDMSFGDDSGTDLPEDNTTTAANNPWVEFANTITFASSEITGSAAITLADSTLVATGTVSGGDITGSASITLENATLSAAGTVAVTGSAAITLANSTLVATGIDPDAISTLTDGYGGDQDTAIDVLINKLNPDWCGDPHNSFEIIGGTQVQKGLIRWILEDIPAGSTCVSATATFTKNDAPNGSYTPTVTFYAVSAANGDWTSGGATITDPAGAGEPTWNGKAADGSGGVTTAWAGSAGLETSGTDYTATAVGSVVAGSGDAAGTQYEVELDTDTVAGWFGESTNPGLVFWSGSYPGGHWAQNSDPTTSYRPVLVVEYQEASSGITGSAAITLANSTLAATGTVTVEGEAAITLGNSTLVATGTVTVKAQASITLANSTLAAAGKVAVDGDAAITLANSTLAAVGKVAVDGDAAITLGNSTLAATGTVTVKAQAAITLGNSSLAAGGTVTVQAQAAISLENSTLAAAGKVAVDGDAAITLANSTLAATGTVTTAGGIVGSAAITLANSTLVAAGTVTVNAEASITLADSTLASAGTVTVRGSAAITLGDSVLAAAGSVTIRGQASITLEDSALVATVVISAPPIGIGRLFVALITRQVGRDGTITRIVDQVGTIAQSVEGAGVVVRNIDETGEITRLVSNTIQLEE
jgi:filamentous hemagglutinin